jgi:hypothetical protein
MANSRAGIRGVVVVEDQRTQRFFLRLLSELGFTGRFTFQIAPSGRGAAENWVLQRAAPEVRALRARPHQRLGLILVRDGDNVGVLARKQQVDEALATAALSPRQIDERIVLPVPTWSVENWLLHLLGDNEVDENVRPASGGATWKERYERQHGDDERAAALNAAAAWSRREPALPSVADGRAEMARLDT